MPSSRSTSRVKQLTIIKLIFLLAGFASFLLSVYLYFKADENDVAGKLTGIFVGIWVPSIFALGGLLLAGERTSR
jgi:hypothetical protein